jgi:hypothetical protein
MPVSARSIIVLLLGTLVCCGQQAVSPKITLSRDKITDHGRFEMKGSGFTPKASVHSHLKRPNGSEFPPLRLLTDDKGEFTHNIDTSLFPEGTHELWVIDSSGTSSNVAKFDVAR